MIRWAPYLTHLASITGAALLTLSFSAPASADDLTDLAARAGLPAGFFETAEAPEDTDAPLPTMKLQDEAELKRMYDERRYSLDRPREKSSDRPFIDWERVEPGAFGGFAYYSTSFKSGPSAVVGVSVRVPIPGIPTGRVAAFAEGFVSHINRDLPFYYNDQAGRWYGAAVGGDYTFYDGNISYLRVRGGVLYADYPNIVNLHSGVGVLVGAELGFYWVRHTDRFRFTITPEWAMTGTDGMLLMTAGLSFYF